MITYKNDMNDVMKLWEASVKASHSFLKDGDIDFYKPLVEKTIKSSTVFSYITNVCVCGFACVSERKVEMLFVAPAYFRSGVGTALLDHAVNVHEADTLEVNEQNKNAVKFYLKNGFKIAERVEFDSEGNNYPLLIMKLY